MGKIDQIYKMDEECDAQEFYLALINALQECLNKNQIKIDDFCNYDLIKYKNYILQTRSSVVDKVFLGALAQFITCLNCKNVIFI